MNNKIIDRILREAQSPELIETLVTRLSQPDLQSLLLEVYHRRTEAVTPGYLFEQYCQNRFVQLAKVNPQSQLEFDRVAFSILPTGFEAVELSPVCPLGTCSAISTVDQNSMLTTIRNTEVCSDPTNVLALECARRRRTKHFDRTKAQTEVKLCASHRVLRTQSISGPGAYPHFRVLGLCSAGRDLGSFKFEIHSLKEHLGFYLDLLMETKKLDIAVHEINVSIIVLDDQLNKFLKPDFVDAISSKYTNINFKIENDEISQDYYLGVRFQIYARNQSNINFLIVDGGFTDWTQQLLSNNKERLLISGIGSERLLSCFHCRTA